MKRRDFMKCGAVSLANLLLPETIYSQEILSAGNLYFKSLSEDMTRKELDCVFLKTLDTFYNIGIGFDNAEITEDFKELKDLDLTVIFLDYVSRDEQFPNTSYGYYK